MKRVLEKNRQLTSAGTKTFGYDQWGNTNKETDANGKVTDIVYDQYGRIVSKITPELSTTYTYNTDGLLQGETSNNGTGIEMTYDGLGRTLTFKETGADGKWLQKSYAYSQGKVATIGYSAQSGTITTETSHYQNGYLKSITLTGGQVIYDLQQENAMGRATKVLSGPVTRNYSFDQYGVPTGRSAQTQTAGTYMNFEYNLNATTGNLNYRKDVTRNVTENFGYDNLNRLTGFAGQTVTYDPKGNITQKSGIGNYHYLNNAKPYALTGIVQSGNVIPERQQQISYASFSRPLTITEDGYTAQFIYEAGGDRVKMEVTQNGASVLTRHYMANQYELDEKPASTREKLYLGGDYYSAGNMPPEQSSPYITRKCLNKPA